MFMKNKYIAGGELPLKGDLHHLQIKGAWQKRGGGVFEGGGGCTPLQTMPPPQAHKNPTFIATIIDICMSCFYI